MGSIFKISEVDRHPIRWKDFVHVRDISRQHFRSDSYLRRVQTMDAIGFDCCKKGGSKRTFKPRRLELGHNFRWDEVCVEWATRRASSVDIFV